MKIIILLISLIVNAFGDIEQYFVEASKKYNINPKMLYSIAKFESNLNSKALAKNRNGSLDIGLMQINSIHLPFLKKLPKNSIFHSSYYRVSNQKDIVNITTVHDFTYEYYRKY